MWASGLWRWAPRVRVRMGRPSARRGARKKGNGAGGSRTLVPGQSHRRLYACIPLFNLNHRSCNGQHPRWSSPQQSLIRTPEGVTYEPARSVNSYLLELSVRIGLPFLGSQSVAVVGYCFCACFLPGRHAPGRATFDARLPGRSPRRPQLSKILNYRALPAPREHNSVRTTQMVARHVRETCSTRQHPLNHRARNWKMSGTLTVPSLLISARGSAMNHAARNAKMSGTPTAPL